MRRDSGCCTPGEGTGWREAMAGRAEELRMGAPSTNAFVPSTHSVRTSQPGLESKIEFSVSARAHVTQQLAHFAG
jgi:hypothetical protein